MEIEPTKIEWSLPMGLLTELSNKGKVYFVGGFVRDKLLKIERTDQDILITNISPDLLIEILRKYGFAEWVGKSFRVAKFHYGGNVYDFSIPSERTIHSARQIPNMSIQDDLRQRDFTINAVAYDITNHKYIDPTGGVEDIENGIIRMVNPDVFSADPLRVIRLCRLRAKLDFNIDKKTKESAISSVSLLEEISSERIGEEFYKIMKLNKPSDAFRCMLKLGILDKILPELSACSGVTQPGGMHAYDVFEHTMRTIDESPAEPLVRFSALFHDITKPRHRDVQADGRARFYGHQITAEKVARKWLTRYAFSHKFADNVAKLVRYHMFTHAETDKGVRRFIRRVGQELIPAIFELRFADTRAQGLGGDINSEQEYKNRVMRIISEKPPLSVRDLEVDGHDVMRILNIPPGPQVGEVLEKLLEMVIDEPLKNDRDILISVIQNMDK